MKILVRKSDDVVMYAEDGLTLSAECATGDGWRSEHFTTKNARLVSVTADSLPDNWTGGVFAYIDGVWHVTDEITVAALASNKLESIRVARKEVRRQKLDTGTVTTKSGTHAIDAAGQLRLTTTILALQGRDTQKIKWRLADDTIVRLDMAELVEILDAVIAQQTAD